jgi:cytochrome c biogenesis protein
MTTTSQAPDTPETPLTEAGGSATTPPTPPSSPPALSPVELSRWAWRQLTSMRTALVLLFLLALTAVPGSVVPQENIDASKVLDWKQAHPQLTPLYDKLGLFSVYSSPWFSAVYLLLMISLVGCVIPRLRVYWRGMRAQPPRVPRHLSRLPESRSFPVADDDPDAVLAAAARVLRRRRYRVATTPAEGGGGAVSAEKGYLREAGNLLFHFSVLVVLVGFGYGQLFGYKGGVITVVGDGFSNSATQYDDLAPGRLFDLDKLSWLTFTVDDFHVKWLTSGPNMGQPESFDANITYQTGPDATPQHHDLAVNHPLDAGGTKVFLVGHGYAPVVTVRGADGKVAYRAPVPFLPQDSTFKSYGVVKATAAAPEQLGFEGFFLPTYGFTVQSGPFSQFPDDLAPALVLTPYHGDLGISSGQSQSVYALDKAKLKTYPSTGTSNPNLLLTLKVGQTEKLPDGSSIRFDGVKHWVKLQISHQPGTPVALVGVLAAIAGLMGSLFIRPRRAWVRVVPAAPAGPGGTGGPGGPDGSGGPGDGSGSPPRRTVVELAGLDRTSGGDLAAEVDAIEELVREAVSPFVSSGARPDVSHPAESPAESPVDYPAQEDSP